VGVEKIRINTDPEIKISLTQDHIDYLDEVSDERDISRSALMRKWLAAGERAESAVIPGFDDPDTSGSMPQDPIEQLFLSELPDTQDNAITVDEMRERLKKKIDGRVMKLYRESDDIAVTNGGEMYADE
jgi:hypothetical protein